MEAEGDIIWGNPFLTKRALAPLLTFITVVDPVSEPAQCVSPVARLRTLHPRETRRPSRGYPRPHRPRRTHGRREYHPHPPTPKHGSRYPGYPGHRPPPPASSRRPLPPPAFLPDGTPRPRPPSAPSASRTRSCICSDEPSTGDPSITSLASSSSDSAPQSPPVSPPVVRVIRSRLPLPRHLDAPPVVAMPPRCWQRPRRGSARPSSRACSGSS